MRSAQRIKVVGHRRVQSPDVWEAVRQLTETAERLRGSRALVPGGVHRFATFEEAHEWMLEKIADTHARIKRALAILPDDAVREVDSDDVERYDVIRIADEVVCGPQTKACGVTWQDADRDSEIKKHHASRRETRVDVTRGRLRPRRTPHITSAKERPPLA